MVSDDSNLTMESYLNIVIIIENNSMGLFAYM